MADIELVIKIDEEDFKIMKHNISANNPLCPLSQEEMVSKVANGTPLPKGHGRIGDLDKIIDDLKDILMMNPDKERMRQQIKAIIDKYRTESEK